MPDENYGAKKGRVRLWVVMLVRVLAAPMVLPRHAPLPGKFGAGAMVRSRAKRIIRRAKLSQKAWQDFLLLSLFVLLFGAAMTATISDGSMPYMKGAWVTQAMR